VGIRVLIADDQAAVRRGLRRVLDGEPDIEVVGEAADGLAAVDAAARLAPDVALVDVRMPGLDGIEVTRRLVAGPRPVRVVVVTTFDLDEYVYPALRLGASGFLLKRSGPALLIEAVRAAMAGDSLISPSVTVRLLRHVTGAGGPAAGERQVLGGAGVHGGRSGDGPVGEGGAAGAAGGRRAARGGPAGEALTEREIEIAGQVAAGRTNADIGRELYISPGTVKTHVASIQRKLGVRNRVGIALHAWEMGYPSPRDVR
jgi:DNA-binding NarL/FixJ family response regulator